MSPRRAKRKAKAEEQAERLMQAGETLAATGKRLNEDPRLLAIVRSLRSVLPGDSDASASLTRGNEGQPRAVGKAVADLTSKRPGVLGEAGLGALQVWTSISEAQGRGKGKTELAIAFTDLVDFSDWALKAGDEAAIELLRDVSVAIEPPVKSHGGEVVKRLGDGMMAVFKSPEGALKGLLEGRERLAEIAVDGYEPRIRAGVHVGKPRKVGKDYFGVDVNIAARVADSAGAGELVISDAALESVGPKAVNVEERAFLDAKGVPESFKVYAVSAKS